MNTKHNSWRLDKKLRKHFATKERQHKLYEKLNPSTLTRWLHSTVCKVASISFVLSMAACTSVSNPVKTMQELPIAPPQVLLKEPPSPSNGQSYQEQLLNNLKK